MAHRRVTSGASPAKKKKPPRSPWPVAQRVRVVDAVCDLMENRGFSMKHALQALDPAALGVRSIPKPSTWLGWLILDQPNAAAFQAQYDAARLARADHYEEETIQIADDGGNDTYVDANGVTRVDRDVIARSQLRIHSRQWLVERMRPKPKQLAIDHTTAGGALPPAVVVLPAWIPLGSPLDTP